MEIPEVTEIQPTLDEAALALGKATLLNIALLRMLKEAQQARVPIDDHRLREFIRARSPGVATPNGTSDSAPFGVED